MSFQNIEDNTLFIDQVELMRMEILAASLDKTKLFLVAEGKIKL